MYVSAFGPRSIAVAVRHGDGLVTSVPPFPPRSGRRGTAWTEGPPRRGELDATFLTASFTAIVMLEEARRWTATVRRPRRDGVGALHYMYDRWRSDVARRSPPLRRLDRLRGDVEAVEPERRHLRVHAGHNCWMSPKRPLPSRKSPRGDLPGRHPRSLAAV